MGDYAPNLGYLTLLNADGSLASPGTPTLQAGEIHLGSVGGYKKSVPVTLTRPAPTTAYTPLDAIGTILAVSAATNATPIVITCDTHSLADGDPVTISGVVGNTAANVSCYAKVTSYSTVTFGMYSDKALTTPIAANGDWSSGGSVAKVLRFPGMARLNGGSGTIIKAQVWTDQKACVTQLSLHLFNAPPAGILDNIAYGSLMAHDTTRVGKVLFAVLSTEDPTASTCASGLEVADGSGNKLPLPYICAVNDTDLYGIPETIIAFTPAAGQIFYWRLMAEVD